MHIDRTVPMSEHCYFVFCCLTVFSTVKVSNRIQIFGHLPQTINSKFSHFRLKGSSVPTNQIFMMVGHLLNVYKWSSKYQLIL